MSRRPDPAEDAIRLVLDDECESRLRAAAARRRVSVEVLVHDLLLAAIERIDDLLDDKPPR